MIKTKEDLKMYLDKDKRALHINKKRPSLFKDEIWKFEIILRKREYYTNCKQIIFTKLARNFYKYLHHRYGLKLGFSIPCNVFGAGLHINHYGYLVVNPSARIGEFCDIHQGVNIGQNIEADKVPRIGNHVFIGPGAKIFGNIEIADNISIGANAVVNRSFLKSNITIAGVPAKIVKNTGNPFEREE